MKTTAENIREIWEEMKERRDIRKGKIISDTSSQLEFEKRMIYLEKKYEEIDILFGNESTLMKAIIFYLSNQQ